MVKKKKKCRKQNENSIKDVSGLLWNTALYKMLSIWFIQRTWKERSRDPNILELLFLILKRKTMWMWLSNVIMQRCYEWVYVFVLNQTISHVLSDMEQLTHYEAEILWKKECACFFHNKKASLMFWMFIALFWHDSDHVRKFSFQSEMSV